jgi:predicted transposase YdaD
MHRNDTLWKSIVEDLFDDLLRFFIDDADVRFDLDKPFVVMDNELASICPSEDVRAPVRVDKLVKVFTRGGGEDHFFLHLEIQGYWDSNFEQRMYQYFYRIKDKYSKPVAAIAILTDPNKYFRPAQYHYAYNWAAASYSYIVYKVLDQDEAVLLKNDNPFSAVILTVLLSLRKRNLTDPELLSRKVDLAKHILSRNLLAKKTKALMNFLKYYVRFDDPKYNDQYNDIIYSINNNPETMGIEEFLLETARQEGRQEGKIEGKQEEATKKDLTFVTSLLQRSNLSLTKIAEVVGVTKHYVQEVKKGLQQASSIA